MQNKDCSSCPSHFFKNAFLALVFLFVFNVQAFGQFVHPGISHKLSDLQRMKAMIDAGVEPWATSFQNLSSMGRAQHDFPVDVLIDHGPEFLEEFNDQTDNYTINDSTTAYLNALMWFFTEDPRHAEKAIEVFNTYNRFRRNTEIPLVSGRVVRLIEAAEIIRHTYDGWDPADIQAFEDMLVFPGYSNTTAPQAAIDSRDVSFYWTVYNGDPARIGNQGLSAIRLMMAMGIFMDNERMYDRAVRMLRGQPHRFDDLPFPSGPAVNGDQQVTCEFYEQHDLDGFLTNIPDFGYNEVMGHYIHENGQSQEADRDQSHPIGGISTIVGMSEIAWNQGDDVYSNLDNRPLLGLEYHVRYNLSIDQLFADQQLPWEPTVESGEFFQRPLRNGRRVALKINPGVNCDQNNVTRGDSNFYPIYELPLAHYRDRIGLPSDDYKWLQRGHDFHVAQIGVEGITSTIQLPLFGSLFYRRVSPGDPISGFDSDGLPQYAMNELPMTIEAENFDFFTEVAAQRASFDNTFLNQGFTYRFDSSSDVFQSTGGGHHVGNTASGEYLTYTISVPETGVYEIQVRASASNNASSVMFSVDGVDATGQVAVPNTGGSQDWEIFTAGQEITLTQGVHQLRVDTFGSFNLDNFTIAEVVPLSVDLSVATGNSSTAPRVSSSDLAQTAFLSSSAVSFQQLGSEHPFLFNGQIGNEDGDSNDNGEVRLVPGDSVTINFDTSVNTAGYDITQIDSVFGWNTLANGRSNQGYSIRFDLVDGSSVEEPGQHWNPNSPAFFWTTVSFTDASGGVILSGVESITFQFTQGSNAGGSGRFVVAREFDIFGTPTAGGAVLGDSNQDGIVNFLDISAFVEVLQSGVYLEEADCNQDGAVDFQDIPAFIAILIGQ